MGAVKSPHRGQFKPGNTYGIKGRPIGARSRLSEIALRMLGADFQAHGEAVIQQVRLESPVDYLRIVASLCPRELKIEHESQLGHLTDQEIEQLEQYLTASRAKTVRQLEQLDGAVIDAAPVAPDPTESA